jgi:hypothetical protein
MPRSFLFAVIAVFLVVSGALYHVADAAIFPDQVEYLPGFDGSLSSWANISSG